MIFCLLRKRTRSLSIFLAFVFVGSFFNCNSVFALTSGPHQPEYMSFESPDANDMVNLLTGDFNMNIPILEIPTDYGPFTLPLSYHAGISPEQEASWVGLGWNINAGAITRSVSNYPDDAKGELRKTWIYDDGGEGWFKTVPMLGNFGWNSEKGHGGRIQLFGLTDIGVYGWKGDNSVIGISVSKSGKVSVDPVELGMSIATIASWGMTKWGGSSAKAVGVTIRQIKDFYNLTRLAKGLVQSNFNGIYNKMTVTSNNWLSFGNYNYYTSYKTDEEMYGVMYLQHQPSDPRSQPSMYNNYHPNVFINGTDNGVADVFKTENINGDGTHIREANSDIHVEFDEYVRLDERGPSSLATDMFTVMGEGVSGLIAPLRMETGTVSHPKKMEETHFKYNLSPFEDYKVQFRYQGEASNYYQHNFNDFNTTSAADYSKIGLSFEMGGQFDYHIEDPKLIDEKKEDNRIGLDNGKLSLAKHIEWYSNQEISNGTAVASGFIDFLNSSTRTTFRAARPSHSIGGFSITREDGLTYHYALPTYNWRDYTKYYKASEPADKIDVDNGSPYANQWLLTGITGPDFVDRGETGIIDQDDWGYWVKFEYGRFSDKFKWRTPYNFDAYSESSLDNVSFKEGKMETYYLDAIKTRTHTALFFKSDARIIAVTMLRKEWKTVTSGKL